MEKEASKMVKITIDGQQFEASEGATVLEVIRANHIHVPFLCYHPALKPSGACKLCAVEVPKKTGEPVIRLSCILRVRDGLDVRTQTELVVKARTRAVTNLLAMAPQSALILGLAEEYGVDVGPPPDGCIRCRLCIRVCKEIVGPGALRMEKRDGKDYVVPNEGQCIGCGTCVNICPTKIIKQEDKEGIRTISIRDEIIGIHQLERCEACGSLFATQKFIRHVTRRATEHHPDVKEHHLYCPTCAKLFSDRAKSFARFKRI